LKAYSACLTVLLFGWLVGGAAHSQTLDEQYEYYLRNKCQSLNFGRDFNQDILPGEAGPNLYAFCTGPLALPSGLIQTINGVGGAAGVAGGRGREAGEDSALRRRREQQRAETQAAEEAESSIADVATGLFTSLDFRDEEQEATQYEGGRRGDRLTASLGLDRRFGRALVAGVAVRGENLKGEFETGGHFEADGFGATLYTSWFPIERLFVDLSGGIDTRSLHTRRIVGRRLVTDQGTFPPTFRITFFPQLRAVDGSTDTQDESADLVAGYDFSLGAFTIGPRIGGAWRRSTIDAFTEIGDTPMSLTFDEREETSLRSAVGLQLSTAFSWSTGVGVPQLNLQWYHEYQDDQQLLSAHFAEDLRPEPVKLRFLNEAPDRDTYSARLSFAAAFKDGLNVFASVEKMFGHEYQDQTGFAVGVRWEL